MLEVVNSFITSLAQLFFCSRTFNPTSEARTRQTKSAPGMLFNTTSSTLSVSEETTNDTADTTTTTTMEPLSPRSSSSFNLSLVSDSMEDDESYDTLLCYRALISQRLHTARGFGLGIYAMSSENENLTFDGLGIVRRHEDGCDGSLSETMLQEILTTFIEDPFHHHSESSPHENIIRHSSPPRDKPTPRLSSCQNYDKTHLEPTNHLTTRTRHFSLPTISSQLKRASNLPTAKSTTSNRSRSASCPNMLNSSQSSKSFNNRHGWRL